MAVTAAETRDAIGMIVVTESVLGLHLHRAVLPRHHRGTVTTVRRVDVIRHLAVVVPLPLPGPGMTAGVTGIGTWIGVGGVIRVTAKGATRREKIGTKEMAGGGTITEIGLLHLIGDGGTRRRGIMAIAGAEGGELHVQTSRLFVYL